MLPSLEGRTRILIAHTPRHPDEALAALHRAGADIRAHFHLIPLIVADIPHETLPFLRTQPGIAHVEPDLPVRALRLGLPWGLRRVHAERLQRLGLTGDQIRVGILDTGVSTTHPLLPLAGGVNLVDRGDFDDHHGHGTAVASVIGLRRAAPGSAGGQCGVAAACSLYAVKVLGDRGIGSVSSVIAGLEWAVDNHMDIVHMSLGTTRHTHALRRACTAAVARGPLLVAAAGNGGNRSGRRDTLSAPARFRAVIAVGAIGRRGARAPFSSTGPGLTLTAPGVDIPCATPGGFGSQSGTSLAAAYVTGVAALLLEAKRVPSRRLRAVLRRSARPKGARHLYGFGLLDAKRALELHK